MSQGTWGGTPPFPVRAGGPSVPEVPEGAREGASAEPPGPGGEDAGGAPPWGPTWGPPSGPPSGPARGRRPSIVAAVVALALAAAAIGSGIGYAVHGSSTPPTTAPANLAPAYGLDTSTIAAAVAPALVNIYATLAYESARGAGTGMVVTSSGRVVTNNHVIAGATALKATDIGNGRTYDVSVVGYDVSEDVAVLQLQGASGLQTVTFSGTGVRLGDAVVAVGNAGGTGTPSAAAGVVTGLDQTITAVSELSGVTEHLSGLIETNAAVEPGQSGGPLVDAHAAVVGMVTAGSSTFEISNAASQGYAVPAARFRVVAAQIVRGDESSGAHVGATAFLGVRVTDAQGNGALVVEVVATSPAAAAGIVPGDLIVGLAGQAVTSPDTVASVIGRSRPGAVLPVSLLGQTGGTRTVTVTLVAGPPA